MKKLLVLLLGLCAAVTMFGCTEKEPEVDEDPSNAGVMTWSEYGVAEQGDPIKIKCYVQGHQSWQDGGVIVYAQDKDGGYFIDKLICSEAEADELVPGTKICVEGYKNIREGEKDVIEDAMFMILTEDTYVAEAEDVTAIIADESALSGKQNMAVIFKGMTVVDCDGTGKAHSEIETNDGDICFKASADGTTIEFCVKYYLTDAESETYQIAKGLEVGDQIDITAFLC